MDTKRKGNIVELKCQTYLYELEYDVAIPLGDNSRYDLILDIGGNLLRVQVKTAKEVEDGVFEFSCRMTRVNCTSVINKTYEKNEIDFFATFYKDRCYLVPVEECSRSKKLRTKPTTNHQLLNINYADDYLAETQIAKYIQNKP